MITHPTVAVRKGKEKLYLPLPTIAYLAGNGNYTIITTRDDSYLMSRTLKAYVEALDADFYRIHKQFVVNLNHIRHVDVYRQKIVTLSMSTGKELTVSRRHVTPLLALLHNRFPNLLAKN